MNIKRILSASKTENIRLKTGLLHKRPYKRANGKDNNRKTTVRENKRKNKEICQIRKR